MILDLNADFQGTAVSKFTKFVQGRNPTSLKLLSPLICLSVCLSPLSLSNINLICKLQI